MPYSVNWYIENEIVYVHYSGVTTAEELLESLLEVRRFMDSSPRNLVHAISDVGDVTESVPIRDSIKVVREVGSHPRSGWMINIREKSIAIKMGSAFGSSVFKLRFRAFDTLDQALAHLKVSDEELSWDKLDKSIAQ